METKFTKGEWEAERSANDRRWHVIGNNLILVEHTFDGDEAEANAKLIAAAPDLLGALESCIRTFEVNRTGGFNGAGKKHESGSPYMLAKAAIRKATEK